MHVYTINDFNKIDCCICRDYVSISAAYVDDSMTVLSAANVFFFI